MRAQSVKPLQQHQDCQICSVLLNDVINFQFSEDIVEEKETNYHEK